MSEFTKEALTAAIYGQESSSGAADTSKANYAGAIGPMQIIRPTFDALKNKGLIPNNFDFNNPEHSKAAGESLVGYLFDKYDGNPSKVAAAYYAGEKAVRADGSIANFKDKKNAEAPSTHDYVKNILSRLGGESASLGTVAGASPVQNTSVLSSWDGGFNERTPKPDKESGVPGRVMQAEAVSGLPPVKTEAERLAGVESQERAVQQASDDTTFMDQSRKAFIQSTFGGAYIRHRAMNQYLDGQQPLQGWKLPDEALVGLSADEQDFMRESVNPQHAERIKMEIDDRRADLATVNTKGTGVGIAATLFAGLPEGYLLGMGAARSLSIAGVGSATLASEGRLGAALMSSTAENVGSNLALTGIQDQFDPYVGTTDYAMAVAGGLLGVAITAPGVFSSTAKHSAMAEMQRINTEAATRTVELREQAVKNLGTEATPEALQAEVRRLESNQIKQTLSAGRGEVPAERRLLPEEDALRSDVEPAVKSDAAGTEKNEFALNRPGDRPDEWRGMSERADEMRKEAMSGKWSEQLAQIEGVNQRWIDKQVKGTHALPELGAHERYKPVVEAMSELQKKFLPDSKIVVGLSKMESEGIVFSAGDSHAIGLRGNMGTHEALTVGVHELGHAVFHENARAIPPQLLSRMVDEHKSFLADLKAGRAEARLKRFAEGAKSVLDTSGDIPKLKGQMADLPYVTNFDEYTAEAFTRYVQRKVRSGELSLPEKAVQLMAAAWEKVKQLYDYASGKGWLSKDEAFDEFFDRVAAGNLRDADRVTEEFLAPGLTFPASFSKTADELVNDPVAVKNGLSLLPVDTDAQKAEMRAVTALYKKATDLNIKVDEKRLSKLMDTAVFQNGQSVANVMLRSENPVVRMVASELLESASGAAGRRSNAAIAKYLNEHAYLGNTLNEFQESYKQFRNASGQNVTEDFFGGKTWEQFNRMVAEEIESRQAGRASVDSPSSVITAADNLEKAYERMRVAQTQTKTIGWGALPETSKGYMPHKMSPEKVRNMTAAQADALHSALREQFISIEGFDISFSENLARKYIDRVQRRALGGFDAPIGVHQVGAADIVEDALTAMGLSKPEVKAMMTRYMKGAANHTKKRLKLDLSAEYPMEDGSSFKLMDLFETDQFRLLRTQASRVSGEVALARHGVMGKSGLDLLRRAMEFGADGQKSTAQELEAFDQVAAEFLGDKFGTQSRNLDRIMQVNSLARLGGMGFTQMAESINGIFHVGAIRTLDAVSSMGRLRGEIKALARGEKVENGILNSIEDFGGAEFGTESYKTVFPFDNGSLQYQTYGKDTVTAADRLLRGGQYLQGKLSLWKTLHSTQQRGFAEQIVRKAAGFIKNGGNDAALRDMGISDELIGRLRSDIDSIAQFDGSKLTNFDITKASDLAAADEFTQAIHRGVSQIIQGTFIGERSKWAHDSVMRIATQFRTFSLTSVEKQWARQVGNVGTAKTLGMMLGAMSLAAPMYMARVHLASIGRADREEYLEKQLQPAQIARATLNYIAMSGLAGDFLDAGTAVTGIGKVTGGRTGNQSEFIGNMVAPSLGLLDDAWKAVQNTKDGTDPHELLKTLPFNRHPLLIPAINALGN